MPLILQEKIRVGVSACNAGARVRWNRAGWDRLEPLGRERNGFLWSPVCPEVMAGLGVPRLPVRLVSGSGDDFWSGKAPAPEGGDVSSETLRRVACDCGLLAHHLQHWLHGGAPAGAHRQCRGVAAQLGRGERPAPGP